MRFLRALWFSLRGLFAGDRVADEIDEELAYHLERETRLHEQSGMTPAAARREAARTFGGALRYREECRDVRRVSLLDDLRTDVRYALRLARHHPGFSVNVVLITALGITACVTTFSLVSGIILAPLDFPGQDRVYSIELQTPAQNWGVIPGDDYLRLAAGSPVFDAVTATEPADATVEINGEPTHPSMAAVTPSFFRVYGIRPALGRPFTSEETLDRAPVIMLGYDEWQTHYAGDRGVLGRTLLVNGTPTTIIGVMPKGFLGNFEFRRFVPTLWLPLRTTRAESYSPIVRLADGVSEARAATWLRTMIHARIPAAGRRDSVAADAVLHPISDQIYGDVERPLLILLAAVVLVLILVAANVATMFLARSASRAAELDVRGALGASAGRQFRQLLTESLTLTAIGGAMGVAASYAMVGTIRKLGTGVLPRMHNVAIDWRVLAFAVGGIALTGCAGGVAHALASRRRLGRVANARPSTHRTSSTLVVVQVALSVVLLVGAGLLVKGFMKVAPTDPGFALHNRAMLLVSLRGQPGISDSDDAGRQRLVADVVGQMRRVAGVTDVAVTSFAPLTGMVSISSVEPEGRAPGTEVLTAFRNSVSPNYFTLMQIPLVRGRILSSADRVGTERVAVINETAAARWWPDGSAVGRRLALKLGDGKRTVTIVGVVRGSRMMGNRTRAVPEMYLPLAQSGGVWATFIAATTVDPRSVLPGLHQALHAVAPKLPVFSSGDLEATAIESVAIQRFYSVAMSLFAVAAVVLSALAVYGLLAFAVAQRRREIGIRLALGASSGSVAWTVIGRASLIGLMGVIAGGLLARGLTRYMESLLVEVTATDPAVFAVAIAVVFLGAVVAACAPTYQAMKVDPIKSLRTGH